MASCGFVQAAVLLLAVQLLSLGAADADQETGTVIPAESRPCVDCHAFEFMQRALQDLKKTAFNLDARTETLVLRAERRALCDCMPTNSLRWGLFHLSSHRKTAPALHLSSRSNLHLISTAGTLISFSVSSPSSGALIWIHASRGMLLSCLIWDDFYTTEVYIVKHACKMSLSSSS